MKLNAGLLAAANWVVALLALCFTPITTTLGFPWSGYHWGDWHGFVSPQLALASGLGAVFFVGTKAPTHLRLLRVGVLLQPFLAATFFWAMNQWPGGDDGGGMGWMLIVGPVSGLCLALAASLAWRLPGRDGGKSGAPERATTAYVMVTAIASNVIILLPWAQIAFGRIVKQ